MKTIEIRSGNFFIGIIKKAHDIFINGLFVYIQFFDDIK